MVDLALAISLVILLLWQQLQSQWYGNIEQNLSNNQSTLLTISIVGLANSIHILNYRRHSRFLS